MELVIKESSDDQSKTRTRRLIQALHKLRAHNDFPLMLYRPSPRRSTSPEQSRSVGHKAKGASPQIPSNLSYGAENCVWGKRLWDWTPPTLLACMVIP